MKEYDQVIQRQIDSGVIKGVPEDEDRESEYLPQIVSWYLRVFSKQKELIEHAKILYSRHQQSFLTQLEN